jgi:hypothetical protein
MSSEVGPIVLRSPEDVRFVATGSGNDDPLDGTNLHSDEWRRRRFRFRWGRRSSDTQQDRGYSYNRVMHTLPLAGLTYCVDAVASLLGFDVEQLLRFGKEDQVKVTQVVGERRPATHLTRDKECFGIAGPAV